METENFIAVTDALPPKPGDYWAYHYYLDIWVFVHWDGHQFPWQFNITHWTDAKEKPSQSPADYVAVLLGQGKARHWTE